MNNFFKSFLSFGLATSIEKLLGFVLLPLYTSYFSVVDYGIIDLIGVTVSILVIFGSLQIETALQRYYYSYQSVKKKLLISNVFILVLILCLILCFILFLFAQPISLLLFDSSKYGNLLRISAFQILFVNINMLGLVVLRFEQQNKKFLLAILVKVLSGLFFAYLFVVFLNQKLEGVFWAQTLSLFITSILIVYFVKDYFLLKVNKIFTQDIFAFSLPQFPARIGSILISQANRFFMLFYLNLAAIGVYSVSLKLASSIQIVNTAFSMAWKPLMMKLHNNSKNKQIFVSLLPIVSAVIFIFVTIITLFSNEILLLFASKEYSVASSYIGALSFYFSLFIIKEVIDIGPIYTKKTKYLSYNFFFSVIVNLLMMFVLIQVLEVKGVVIAMIITNLSLISITWYNSNKLYPISFKKVEFCFLCIPVLLLVSVFLFCYIELKMRAVLAFVYLVYYGVFLYQKKGVFKEIVGL